MKHNVSRTVILALTISLLWTASNLKWRREHDNNDTSHIQPKHGRRQLSETQRQEHVAKFMPRFLDTKRLNLTTPEDVGLGHTQLIHELQKRMTEVPPTDYTDYLRHLASIVMEHLCHPTVVSCTQRIAQDATHSNYKFENGYDFFVELMTEQYDSVALNSIHELFQHIGQLQLDQDPTLLLESMKNHFQQLQINSTITNETDRMVGLIAYSVGMESAREWHSILNKPTNPFRILSTSILQNQMQNHDRKLQDDGGGGGGVFSNIVSGITGIVGGGGGGTDGGAGGGAGGGTDGGTDGAGTDGSISALGIDITKLVEVDVIGATAGAVSSAFDIALNRNVSLIEKTFEYAVLFSAREIIRQLTPEDTGITGITGIIEDLTGGGGNGDGDEGGDEGGSNLVSGITNLISGFTGGNNNDSKDGGAGGGGEGGNAGGGSVSEDEQCLFPNNESFCSNLPAPGAVPGAGGGR